MDVRRRAGRGHRPRLADDLAVAALALARRFAAGATMWCVSPQWPAHGRHVAVEFVHPVIVGKRALPAVHVEGTRPGRRLRLLARPGDVLIAVSTADDPATVDLLRRAEAWGLTRIWLGAGTAPADRSRRARGVAGQRAIRTGRPARAIWSSSTTCCGS